MPKMEGEQPTVKFKVLWVFHAVWTAKWPRCQKIYRVVRITAPHDNVMADSTVTMAAKGFYWKEDSSKIDLLNLKKWAKCFLAGRRNCLNRITDKADKWR